MALPQRSLLPPLPYTFITEYLSSVTLCIPGLWASHALSKGGPMTPHLVCLEQGAGLSRVSQMVVRES